MIGRLEWDQRNEDHISRHGVTRWEVEELRRNNPFVRRVGRRRFRAVGITDAGRYLSVFLDRVRGDFYYVVTARDAVAFERRQYRAARE